MPKQQEIKLLSNTIPVLDRVKQMNDVGNKMKASVDTDIHAEGILLLAAAKAIDDALTAKSDAVSALASATDEIGIKDTDGGGVYKDSVALLTKKFPHDTVSWLSFDVELTKEPRSGHAPTPPDNCSMSQGDFAGIADVHNDPVKHEGVVTYSYKASTAPDGTYVQLADRLGETVFKKTSNALVIPIAMLGKKIYIIATTHNSHGPSSDSDSFGGRNIN